MDVFRKLFSGGCSPARMSGFSLFELIYACCISGLLLGIGIPSFNSFIEKARFDSDVTAIRSALSFARHTSIMKNKRIIVCHWNGVDGCTGNSARGVYNWTNGLAVYIDLNEDKTLNTPSEEIIKVFPMNGFNDITWSKGEVVAFKSNGSAAGYFGSFIIDAEQQSAELILSMTGRLRYYEL